MPWKRVEQRPASLDRPALERLGHQRRRGLGDGAAGAFEGDVADRAVVELHVDLQPVAAQRVVALGAWRRSIGAEVPRPPVVVEDHFLVELGQSRTSLRTPPHLVQRRRPARRPRRACCRGPARRAPWPARRSAPSPAGRSGGRCGSRRPRWSRMVPMSCGCTPSSTNDSTLALSARGADEAHAGHAPTAPRCRRPAARARGRRSARGRRRGRSDRRRQADRARDVRRAGLELVRQRVPGGLLEGDRRRSCRRRPGKAASPRAARSCRRARRCRSGRRSCGRRTRRSRSRAPARRPAGAGPPARRRPAPRAPAACAGRDDLGHRVDRAERVRDVAHGHEPRARRRAAPSNASRSSSPRRRSARPAAARRCCSQSICQGTMFEWCSIAEMSTSSPAGGCAGPSSGPPG